MKTIVNGRNIELTDAIKAHINEKFEKLQNHYDFLQKTDVFLSVEKNPSIKDSHLAEVTLHIHGTLIRVSVAKSDLYASIDELVRKADRSLRKYKTKNLKRHKGYHADESIRKPESEEPDATNLDEDEDGVEWIETETTTPAPAMTS